MNIFLREERKKGSTTITHLSIPALSFSALKDTRIQFKASRKEIHIIILSPTSTPTLWFEVVYKSLHFYTYVSEPVSNLVTLYCFPFSESIQLGITIPKIQIEIHLNKWVIFLHSGQFKKYFIICNWKYVYLIPTTPKLSVSILINDINTQ